MKNIKKFAKVFWALRVWVDEASGFSFTGFEDFRVISSDRFSVGYPPCVRYSEVQKMLAKVLPCALKDYEWILEGTTIYVAGYTISVTFDCEKKRVTFTCDLSDYEDIDPFIKAVLED